MEREKMDSDRLSEEEKDKIISDTLDKLGSVIWNGWLYFLGVCTDCGNMKYSHYDGCRRVTR